MRKIAVFRRNAFTLIELLVVIAVIGILAAMLLPALSEARNAAVGMQCVSNMRQIGLMLNLYADSHRGWLPVADMAPEWGTELGWTNLLRKTQDADKKIFHCARDSRRDFSYSLNCREPFQRNRETFCSWNQLWLDRTTTGASSLILIEESDTSLFEVTDSDHDNYTQDTEPKDPERHNGFGVTFGDGHAERLKKYDFTRVSYYTDRFSKWLESNPYSH